MIFIITLLVVCLLSSFIDFRLFKDKEEESSYKQWGEGIGENFGPLSFKFQSMKYNWLNITAWTD